MDNSNLIIRLIETGDVNDMWENIFPRNTPEEIKQRIDKNIMEYEKKWGFHVVAEVDSKVIGTLGLLRFNEYQRFANLFSFVIYPDYQGKGIARKLLEKTIETAKQFEIDTLSIQARSGESVIREKYKSLGFTEVFESGGLAYFMMAV